MVDAQARVLLPVLTEIVPERVHTLFRIQVPHRVNPTLAQQPLKALAALRLKECILEPRAGVVDIKVGEHNVLVTREDNRVFAGL